MASLDEMLDGAFAMFVGAFVTWAAVRTAGVPGVVIAVLLATNFVCASQLTLERSILDWLAEHRAAAAAADAAAAAAAAAAVPVETAQ